MGGKNLSIEIHPAIDFHDAYIHVPREGAELLCYLIGEFAGGTQYDHLRSAETQFFAFCFEVL